MLSDNLKKSRKLKGYTQDEIAKLLNVKRQTYGAYERGISSPDVVTLQKLADLFDVSIDYLLGKEEPSATETEGDIKLDDFTYALYGETKELTDEQKQQLLRMARFMKTELDNNKGKKE